MKNINMLELQKGLHALADGFKLIANAIEVNEVEVRTPIKEEIQVEEEVVEEPKVEEVEPVEPVEVKQEVQSDGYDRVSLEKMSYRELQQVAKDNDILATGKKEELVDRLLGEETKEVVETIEEVVEPEVEEIEEEEEEEEVEVEETEVVTKADRIAQALEGYSEEELADVLSSIGESPKGKRQALLAKIVKAVDEGLLEIELEDEDEEVLEEPTLEVEEVEEVDEVEMTVPRQRAVAQAREEVREMIKSGSLSEKQMNDILAYVYAGEEFSPALPLKEREGMLEEMYVNLVDDEGISQELETPYVKDGEYACCSKVLRKKDNGNLGCIVCDQEYEID